LEEVIPMMRVSESLQSRMAAWKRIGLVFGVATLLAGSAVADNGDLLRGRNRRLQPPSGPQAGAIKEQPNPGGEVIEIPDPRPKRRTGRGPQENMPAAIESAPQSSWNGWFAWFVLRARH
jgi:hypothetical protein